MNTTNQATNLPVTARTAVTGDVQLTYCEHRFHEEFSHTESCWWSLCSTQEIEGQRPTLMSCCCQLTATQSASSSKPHSVQSLGCLGSRKTWVLRRVPALVDVFRYNAGGKEGLFSVLTSQCTPAVESRLLFAKLRIADTGASPQLQWGVQRNMVTFSRSLPPSPYKSLQYHSGTTTWTHSIPCCGF